MAEHSEEFESLSWRCKDEGHEFLCRMAEGSCVRCIPQQARSQQALTDQFAVGYQAVTRLGAVVFQPDLDEVRRRLG